MFVWTAAELIQFIAFSTSVRISMRFDPPMLNALLNERSRFFSPGSRNWPTPTLPARRVWRDTGLSGTVRNAVGFRYCMTLLLMSQHSPLIAFAASTTSGRLPARVEDWVTMIGSPPPHRPRPARPPPAHDRAP